MEIKKSPQASLEDKRVLFAEIGLVLSLLIVLGAFSYSTHVRTLASLASDIQIDDVVEIVPPVTRETPPPPPAVSLPVLSDQIEIVENDLQVDDFFSVDDSNLEVTIYDYIEEVKDEIIEDETFDFVRVEKKPTFNNGDANAFSAWVGQHLVYPEISKENNVQGRVILQFTVLKDGSVGNVKVIRSVDAALDKEAVRVVSSSPKWEPGRQRDRAVNVTYTFPVIFQLR
jgi:protein TonB